MKTFFTSLLAVVLFLSNVVCAHSLESNFWNAHKPILSASLAGSIPLKAARIKEMSIGSKSAPTVVLIEDVHLNKEAQLNISEVLLSLNKRKPMIVGVEGAFGAFDFSSLRDFENKPLAKKVADAFLQGNHIAAPSYVGITADQLNLQFHGVDDKTSYDANVDAYRTSLQQKESVSDWLNGQNRELIQEKKNLSPALQKMELTRSSYRTDAIGLGDYLEALMLTADELGLDAHRLDLSLQQFDAAFQIERTLDIKKVERERSAIIEKLAPRLNQTQMARLVEHGRAYQSGALTFGGYYKTIQSLIDDSGLSLKETPAFSNYIRYALLADGIKPEQVLTSVRSLENDVYEQLIKTDHDKATIEKANRLYLIGKLIDFALTPEEWEQYKTLGIELITVPFPFRGRVRVGETPPLSPPQMGRGTGQLRKDSVLLGKALIKLNSFENFYEQADLRSEKMVENLLAHNPSEAVLIAGGFHTPHLVAELKKRGVSIVVVQPSVTKIDSSKGTSYLSIFAREKTSLDKMFEGKTLFLAPTSVAAGYSHPATDRFRGVVRALDNPGDSEVVVCPTHTLSADVNADRPMLEGEERYTVENQTVILGPKRLSQFLRTSIVEFIPSSLDRWTGFYFKHLLQHRRRVQAALSAALAQGKFKSKQDYETYRRQALEKARAELDLGSLWIILGGVAGAGLGLSSAFKFPLPVVAVAVLIGWGGGAIFAHTYYLVEAEKYGWIKLTLDEPVQFPDKMMNRPDGKVRAVAFGSKIQFIHLRSGDVLATIGGEHQATVTAMAFSPDGKKFVYADDQATVTPVNLSDMANPKSTEYMRMSQSVSGLQFSDDGKSFFIRYADGQLAQKFTESLADFSEFPPDDKSYDADFITHDGQYRLHWNARQRKLLMRDLESGGSFKIDASEGPFSKDGIIGDFHGDQFAFAYGNKVHVFVSVKPYPRTYTLSDVEALGVSFAENGNSVRVYGPENDFDWFFENREENGDSVTDKIERIFQTIDEEFGSHMLEIMEVPSEMISSIETIESIVGGKWEVSFYSPLETILALARDQMQLPDDITSSKKSDALIAAVNSAINDFLGTKNKIFLEKDNIWIYDDEVLQKRIGETHVGSFLMGKVVVSESVWKERDIHRLLQATLRMVAFGYHWDLLDEAVNEWLVRRILLKANRMDQIDFTLHPQSWSAFRHTFDQMDPQEIFSSYMDGDLQPLLHSIGRDRLEAISEMEDDYYSDQEVEDENDDPFYRLLTSILSDEDNAQHASLVGQIYYTLGLVLFTVPAAILIGDLNTRSFFLFIMSIWISLSAYLSFVLPWDAAATESGRIDWQDEFDELTTGSFAQNYVVAQEFWHSQTTSKAQWVMNIPILGTLLIRGIDEFLAMTFGLMVSVLLTNKATEWLGVRFLILFVPVRTIGESKMPALNARFQRAYARGVLNGNRANLVRSLIGLMPIMELGINKQINGAAEQGLLSDRDLFTLQLLADRRTAYSVSNEYGIFNTPDNFKRDVVLEMVNPYEDGYHAKLRELNNTSRFQNTVVYLPVDSRELRGLGITFRNLRLTNQLTSKAIRTALQTKDPMRLTVRVHSKNPAFLNGRRVQLLQRLERSKAFTGVEIFLFVRLEKLLMAIPVTSGDLLRMIELELKVSRLASTHA